MAELAKYRMTINSYLSSRVLQPEEPPDELELGPGVVDASFGEPDEKLFPLEIISDATSKVLSAGRHALQYSPMRGVPELVTAIANWAGQLNAMEITPGQVVITSGSIPAFLLLSYALVDAGDTVIFEEPGYYRLRKILEGHGARLLSFSTSNYDAELSKLGTELGKRRSGRTIAFVNPTLQNPTGYTWTLEQRLRFLELCTALDILIVEDTAYDALGTGLCPSSLLSLSGGSGVIQVGTLSKVIAPGLGVGWIIGAPELIRVLVDNRVEFGGVGSMTALIAAAALGDERFTQHVANLRATYAKRCADFCCSLEEIAALRSWRKPIGGFYAWIPARSELSDVEFSALVLRNGLRVLPGFHFQMSQEDRQHYIRVTFGRLSDDEIRTAGKVLHRSYAATEVESAESGTLDNMLHSWH